MEILWPFWSPPRARSFFNEVSKDPFLPSARGPLGDGLVSERERLFSACTEFEALFLEMIIKGMRKTVPQTKSHQREIYQSLLDQELAHLMSRRGIGLAQMMTQRLSHAVGHDLGGDRPQVFSDSSDISFGDLRDEDYRGVSSAIEKDPGEER